MMKGEQLITDSTLNTIKKNQAAKARNLPLPCEEHFKNRASECVSNEDH